MALESVHFKFSDISEFTEAIQRTQDMETLLVLFQKQIENLGFHSFTYWVIWPKEGPRQPLYISTFRKDYSRHYIDNDFKNKDLAWYQTTRTILPFTWTRLLKGRSSDDPYKIVFNESREFSIKSGGTIPYYGPGLARAAISVACDYEQDKFDVQFKRYQHYLQIIGSYLHEKIINLDIQQKAVDLPALSAREREILLWIAKGKTNWEIGSILALSENTVKRHVQNICAKLKVVNKTQATAYAILHGIIVV